MKPLTSLYSFLSIALSILFVSRFVQYSFRELKEPNNISVVGRLQSEAKCLPKKNSFLQYLYYKNTNDLFIVLDGYPVRDVFSKVSGKQSSFLNWLADNSDNFIEEETVINSTPYSLAYILARHRPDSGCTFPFLSNRLNIKYLTASRFFSDQDSLCVNYVNSNRLGTYANLIVNEISSQNFKLSNSETDSIANSIVAGGRKINIECTLFSKAGRDQILKKLEFLKNKRISNPQLKNGIYFIHDLSFHDYIEKYKSSMNGIGSVGSEFLKWDRLHKDVITQFIQDIRRDYLVDNVHIMSDHGPRLPNIPSFLGEGTVPSKDYPEGRADYGSFMSKYNYGYFIGSFNITKRLQNFPFWNTQNASIDKWDLLDGVPYQLCRYRCWED